MAAIILKTFFHIGDDFRKWCRCVEYIICHWELWSVRWGILVSTNAYGEVEISLQRRRFFILISDEILVPRLSTNICVSNQNPRNWSCDWSCDLRISLSLGKLREEENIKQLVLAWNRIHLA